MRKLPAILTAILAGFAMSSSCYPALAQGAPMPPLNVAVQGQPLEWNDIAAFLSGLYKPHPDSPQVKMVQKSPDAMPSDAPYVSYQGRDAGPAPTEIVWMSSGVTQLFEAKANAESKAYAAASVLALMDAGNAGSTLQAIYAKTPSDRASRIALGESFATALQNASDQAAAFSAEQAQWIRKHIVPGITRESAYALLKSKGLTAYNWAFINGKPIPPMESPAPDHPTFGGGCDTSDHSSAAWPYKGEPLPKQEGVCAAWSAGHRPKSMANPEAQIELGGAFNIRCSWSTYIAMRFDAGDRVTTVQIDQPRSTCL